MTCRDLCADIRSQNSRTKRVTTFAQLYFCSFLLIWCFISLAPFHLVAVKSSRSVWQLQLGSQDFRRHHGGHKENVCAVQEGGKSNTTEPLSSIDRINTDVGNSLLWLHMSRLGILRQRKLQISCWEWRQAAQV